MCDYSEAHIVVKGAIITKGNENASKTNSNLTF